MESDDSPYYESFDSDTDHERTLHSSDKISVILEKYYAVFYDLNWYVGRVVDFPKVFGFS